MFFTPHSVAAFLTVLHTLTAFYFRRFITFNGFSAKVTFVVSHCYC